MKGPYVTSVAAESWEPFELEDGRVVGEAHVLRGDDTDGGSYYNGFWRVLDETPPEPFPYATELNETIYVLEGELTIEVEGGPTLDLAPGDMASFVSGTRSTWRLTKTPFREVFVLS